VLTAHCQSVLAQPRVSMQLGLWIHDPFDPENVELSRLGEDGVLLLHPHEQYISGMEWLHTGSNACQLITSSYDGSVLLLDAVTEKFLVLHRDTSDELSAIGCRDSNCILTGDNMVWLPLEVCRSPLIVLHTLS
jgi:WD40 repeat protein